ncbi:MAG TPA: glycoside hydrolase family 2 TIM barrel-domain containing protein [Bacilli bacterium]|nr:glycoside hydrolase family 2 TIM barrel-domain containing protein [Bacilli bacterium]
MRTPLNFAWRFIDRFDTSYLQKMPKEAISIDVPHTIKQLPFSYFSERDYQIFGTYEKIFSVPRFSVLDAALLTFEGIMVKARFILNGIDLKAQISAYNKITIDVSDAIKEGENRLIVIVDAREDKLVPPFGGVVDYLSFGGIYREVYLDVVPRVYIENLYIDASVDGKVQVRYDMVNVLKDKFDLRYEVALNDEIVGRYYEDEFELDNPKLWSLEDPNVYKIKATLKTKYGVQTILGRFGFREAKFTPKGFFLNGKHIKLRGLNRHQSYPYVGYAMPKSMQQLDADIMKNELGINITRTSHYPPSRHFLDRCDELGILVFIESPGWQHIGTDEKWIAQYKINIERMVKDHYNHPSIVLWGVRINEGPDYHDLYSWANDFVHQFDKHRQTGGVRNFKNSELLEDVYTYNDFVHEGDNVGVDDPKDIIGKGIPYLVTEFGGHMYPTKSYDDESHRVNQALRHFRVLNDLQKYPQISGGIGWVFADYQTHKDFGSGDRICHHGVLDQFRHPKYAASVYQSQRDDVVVLDVLSRLQLGDHPKGIIGETVIASNVDYIELYKNDEFVAKFLPKRDAFPYLAHPPFIIDDYIGEAILKSGRFSKMDAGIIKEALRIGAIKGFSKLGFINYSKIGLVMVKNKLKYKDLVDLWYQFVLSWGTEMTKFTFKGYRGGELVIEKSLAAAHEYHLEVTTDREFMVIDDTYDVLRVSVRLLDEYGMPAFYAQEAVSVKVSNELEVLGPSVFPLTGGQTSFYVKTRVLDKAVGKIAITTPDYGEVNLKINIVKST